LINIKHGISLTVLLMIAMASLSVTGLGAVTNNDVRDFLLNTYNPNINAINSNIPFVKSVFGGQVIDIIIKDPSGNIEMGAITDANGNITELSNGTPSNPTLRLISNTETIENIKNSADPFKATKDAIKAGDITYEGVGVVSTINVAILKLVMFFAKLFGAI
jgi:hypothetical protein